MKLKVIIPLLMILLAFSASADFSAQKGFDWLVSKGVNGNYNNDITTTAFAVLAFKDAGINSEAEKGVAWIKSQEDTTSHCFPKGSCRVKDTSLAYMVLKGSNQANVLTEDWLRNALSTATSTGNWWLQVATDNNGTCKISYIKNNVTKEKTVTVNKGEFEGCSGSQPSTFYDLNTCIEPGLLSSNPLFKFDVDCSSLGSAIISVIYNSDNTYRIIQEASTSKATIKINNGCYGTTSKSACTSDVSSYANWALYQSTSDINIIPWLSSNYNANDVAQLSLITYSSLDNSFLTSLKAQQKSDKSFGDVYQTSLAILALKQRGNIEELGNAIDWLKSKQSADGSWNSNILHTAAALYSAFTRETIVIVTSGGGSFGQACLNGIKDAAEDAVDCGGPCAPCTESLCGDGVCSIDESQNTCPQDCSSESSACVVNSKCEVDFGENSQNCQADCFCGDNICDSTEDSLCQDCSSAPSAAVCGNSVIESGEFCDDGNLEDKDGCSSSCQEEKKSRLGKSLITILIILILLAAIAYYIINKRKHQGPDASSSQSPKSFTPYSSQLQSQKNPAKPSSTQAIKLQGFAPQKKTRIEDELDRSIAEAKNLLKK